MRHSRILVVALIPIGDTLFATPVLRALRQGFPQAHITAVTSTSNRDILEGNPDLDALLAQPTRQYFDLALVRDLWRGLREVGFDLGISLNPFLTPVFRLLTRTARWLALPLPPWWWLVSHRRGPWGATHAVTHYLRTLEPLGLTADDPTPRVYPSPEERRWARAVFAHRGVRETDFVLAVHPGGEGWRGRKRWTPEGFARVAQELARRYRGVVLLVGGRAERDLTEDIAARLDCPRLNLAGETSLRQTAALLERATLFVGNDSSPLHLAAAVGTPVVGIYGPSNPEQFAPRSPRAAMVRSGRPCAPCFHFVGTQAVWDRPWRFTAPCMAEITPERVIMAAVALLSRSGTQHRSA
ncbi:MAG: glycosyltransferase family 9 protein [Chloroflexi bacterium]|nr:glycosyltransferase family 9 protein [Chloroflexota bacterium]